MTSARHFVVRQPDSAPVVPLVVHVPHSSTHLAAEFRSTLAISDSDLATEVRLMTDHFTDEFADGATAVGGTVFVNRLSRLVMDPERFPNDVDEPMAKLGMGAVYLSRQDGTPLRVPEFSKEQRANLIAQLYEPYHRALERVVADQLGQFGCCLIVDLHSFPKKSLPYENPALARPSICLGFDDFHVDAILRDRWSSRIEDAGLDVAFNAPFAGSLVPSHFYGRDRRVRSLMIELRRDLYMVEETGKKSNGFTAMHRLVNSLLGLAAERCCQLSR